MEKFISDTPLIFFVVMALTLGLAPFTPPHLYEKIIMLFNGKLIKLVDWFDFFMHLTPWVLLIIKVVYTVKIKQ